MHSNGKTRFDFDDDDSTFLWLIDKLRITEPKRNAWVTVVKSTCCVFSVIKRSRSN